MKLTSHPFQPMHESEIPGSIHPFPHISSWCNAYLVNKEREKLSFILYTLIPFVSSAVVCKVGYRCALLMETKLLIYVGELVAYICKKKKLSRNRP
jgi:hypothetical protein